MTDSRIRQMPGTQPNEYQKQQMERRFGMFLHFGVNTFGNVEWSDGSIPALCYQPRQIDADQWIRTAYEAGMNYVVLVTKHHDGFCLWNTEYTDYCVKNSGNTADVVMEVSQACRKYGLKLGLYYSLWDRSEPRYRQDFSGQYLDYMQNQLTELLDGRYGEVVELWLDGAWDRARSDWQLERLYDYVKRMQPACQIGVNHTVGTDFDRPGQPEERYLPAACQEGDPLRMFPSDFRLWDPHMCACPDPKLYTYQNNTYYLPFEMTICSRQGFSWFYSNIYEKMPFLDVKDTVEKCRIAFAARNMVVINLPPDTDGRLVQSDIDHLMQIADGLGTRRGQETRQ